MDGTDLSLQVGASHGSGGPSLAVGGQAAGVGAGGGGQGPGGGGGVAGREGGGVSWHDEVSRSGGVLILTDLGHE